MNHLELGTWSRNITLKYRSRGRAFDYHRWWEFPVTVQIAQILEVYWFNQGELTAYRYKLNSFDRILPLKLRELTKGWCNFARKEKRISQVTQECIYADVYLPITILAIPSPTSPITMMTTKQQNAERMKQLQCLNFF